MLLGYNRIKIIECIKMETKVKSKSNLFQYKAMTLSILFRNCADGAEYLWGCYFFQV